MEALILRPDKVDLVVTEITLLSAEEYETSYDKIRGISTWWWLRSAGKYRNCAATVFSNGTVCLKGIYVHSTGGGVRPALRIDSKAEECLHAGDRMIIAGRTWEYIGGNLLLADEAIGKTAFREEEAASDANVFEASDVKRYLENWAKNTGIEICG